METSTLQRHLAKETQPDTGEKRLYVLDESSLASTRQITSSSNVSIGMIGCCWYEIVANMKPSKRAVLSRNCKKRGCGWRPPICAATVVGKHPMEDAWWVFAAPLPVPQDIKY